MTDIVERLRRWGGPTRPYGSISDTCDEAAAEITRLRAEVERVGRDYNTVRDAHDDWVRESERLRVEVKKMRADIAYADKHASKVEGLLWGTAKENEKLRAALEFYGKPENWESVWDHQFRMMVQEPAYRDKGNIARTALEER